MHGPFVEQILLFCFQGSCTMKLNATTEMIVSTGKLETALVRVMVSEGSKVGTILKALLQFDEG